MGKNKTWLTLNEGILVLKKNKIKSNRVTFLSWVKKYDLGHKVGGRWVIFPERVEKFMKENFHIGKIYAKKK
jgi:hypothetical protein|tara:strand:- start:706 stop:921 length:216 start_codon:yes stop_codon:yes gene_type:complete